jgi:hypothetical protein
MVMVSMPGSRRADHLRSSGLRTRRPVVATLGCVTVLPWLALTVHSNPSPGLFLLTAFVSLFMLGGSCLVAVVVLYGR